METRLPAGAVSEWRTWRFDRRATREYIVLTLTQWDPKGPGMRTMNAPSVSPSRKDERVNLRIDAKTKALLQQAAEINGSRLTEFLLTTAVTRAQRLLSRTTVTRVSDDEFYRVLDAIDNPPAPTDYLVDALR